jgi:lipopolysaccharide export system permease protein
VAGGGNAVSGLDRYILTQILGPFGFFALVFTALLWLTQSLRIIDLIVNNGQSAAIFAEFTALLLPAVMAMVLPLSAFAATLFVLNRLAMESELVAMMSAGRSHARLARPVAVFGLLVMAAMLVDTMYLMPTAARVLRDRMADLRSDVANALIREGQFVHPAPGLTVFVADASRTGEMAGIFIHDQRDPAAPVTYSANRAALVRAADGARVVMFDGAAQRLDSDGLRLSTLRFETLAYDLSALMQSETERFRRPSEHYVSDLLAPPAELRGSPRFRLGEFTAEGHEQLGAPLYGLALPLLALAFLTLGGYRRRGLAAQIWLAVGLATAIRLAGVAAKSATVGNAALWPLMYLPSLGMLVLVVWAIRRASGPGRPEAAAS